MPAAIVALAVLVVLAALVVSNNGAIVAQKRHICVTSATRTTFSHGGVIESEQSGAVGSGDGPIPDQPVGLYEQGGMSSAHSVNGCRGRASEGTKYCHLSHQGVMTWRRMKEDQ